VPCLGCLGKREEKPTKPNPNQPPITTTVSTEASDLSWDDPTGGSAAATDESSALTEMAPFENYILGILTNFSAVALDRLHNLLRVFVVGEPKYEGRSQEQLGAFLAHLVGQGKVEVDNGVYKRKKGG
jgi:anaphase-promoting complex subunit 2